MSDFPKVLIATEFSPNAGGGGPAFMRQMLKNYPLEKVFWWSCLPENKQILGIPIPNLYTFSIPSKLYPNRKFSNIKSWILENIWSPLAAKHFINTLNRVKPEIVWIIPHQWSIPPLYEALIRKKVSIKFHVTMQDFVDCRKENITALGIKRSQRMASWQEELYQKAQTRDATSHPMADYLLQKTTKSASQISNPGAEPEEIEFLKTYPTSLSSTIRIAHCGTIVVPETFEILINTLSKLRQQYNLPLYIEFFGGFSNQHAPWYNPEWMKEHGYVSDTELMQHLYHCTFAIAIMSLTDNEPRYNRYSFPGKFIKSLAAGLPLLSIAHPESSIAKMHQIHSIGFYSYNNDIDILAKEMFPILSLKNPREHFKKEILYCLEQEFDAQKIRNKLYQCLLTSP